MTELDAVTFDAFGTLARLRDPVPGLRQALAAQGIERDEEAVRAGFDAEAVYYKTHRLEARDEAGLSRLYEGCTRTFLEAVGAELQGFDYAGFFEYEVVPGVEPALRRLRACGLELAVVANWDASLRTRLRELGLDRYFSTVVTAADVGVEKPDAAPFRIALERLGVSADRALHVGDQPADEQGARAAGMHFAPAPVAEAVAAWQ